MSLDLVVEANRLKSKAGADLGSQLKCKFDELVSQGIIRSYESGVNFPHQGYSYDKQYLANFILETLDGKIIVISSSTSYRNDRVKIRY